MSTLFKGQKDTKRTTIFRLVFSSLILVSVIGTVLNFYNSSKQPNANVQAGFSTEMNFLPLGGDVDAGKALFQAKACFACHGMNLEGNQLGPNLTDDFSKHGCSAADMTKVISNGVAGTAMVAFSTQLKPEEIKQLVAYIISVKGTKPANAKAPEGEKCK